MTIVGPTVAVLRIIVFTTDPAPTETTLAPQARIAMVASLLVTQRAAKESIRRGVPPNSMLIPTSVPMTHALLDGHVLQIMTEVHIVLPHPANSVVNYFGGAVAASGAAAVGAGATSRSAETSTLPEVTFILRSHVV